MCRSRSWLQDRRDVCYLQESFVSHKEPQLFPWLSWVGYGRITNDTLAIYIVQWLPLSGQSWRLARQDWHKSKTNIKQRENELLTHSDILQFTFASANMCNNMLVECTVFRNDTRLTDSRFIITLHARHLFLFGVFFAEISVMGPPTPPWEPLLFGKIQQIANIRFVATARLSDPGPINSITFDRCDGFTIWVTGDPSYRWPPLGHRWPILEKSDVHTKNFFQDLSLPTVVLNTSKPQKS